jgi:hypothetical protein
MLERDSAVQYEALVCRGFQSILQQSLNIHDSDRVHQAFNHISTCKLHDIASCSFVEHRPERHPAQLLSSDKDVLERSEVDKYGACWADQVPSTMAYPSCRIRKIGWSYEEDSMRAYQTGGKKKSTRKPAYYIFTTHAYKWSKIEE